jgi:Domain of unknown function (DUF4407)
MRIEGSDVSAASSLRNGLKAFDPARADARDYQVAPRERRQRSAAQLFYRVAGIDPEVIARCPGSDRLWGIQLGVSLLIGFIFVFSLSYYSLGYLLEYEPEKLLIAALIASIVFMFDRALFQSDWFYMGAVQQIRGALQAQLNAQSPTQNVQIEPTGQWTPWRYAGRIIFRLGLSLLVAYTLSLFVELAMFGDAISEKIEAKFQSENVQYYEALRQAQQAIDVRMTDLRQRLQRLNQEFDNKAGRIHAAMSDEDRRSYDYDWSQIADNEKQMKDISAQIETNDQQIRQLSDDIGAEIHGAKLRPEHTGKRSCGPVCQTEKAMVTNAQIETTTLNARYQALAKRTEGLEDHIKVITDKYDHAQKELVAEHDREVGLLETQIAANENNRGAQLQAIERRLKEAGLFHERRDDPLLRVQVLQQLKNDPERGAVVAQLSLMIRLFIIFLEMAPVVGKMFFSPPSAYAWIIRSQVGREQVTAMKQMNPAEELDCSHLGDGRAPWTVASKQQLNATAARV